MKLREIFRLVKLGVLKHGWLYLPAHQAWTTETEAVFFGDGGEEGKDFEEVETIARERKLVETLDDHDIENVVNWADHLAGREDDAARVDVFRYYHRFDNVPDRLGAPDPNFEEIQFQQDRQFFESLGPERPDTRCQQPDCTRGTTRFSVFCPVHQFEKVQGRPCPFGLGT